MIDKKPVIFLLLATAVILVGTVVTMVAPFRYINDPKLKLAGVKPYTPLQLEGRDIYIREGCNNCHTQTVRPLLADVERYGDYSKAGDFVYDQPHLWGSRRTGPDLARIGGKYPDVWHYKHMADPQSMVPRTNMPKYAFLTQPLDSSMTERKMKALGFPYTPAEVTALKGKTEMDAMLAYLQKLGNDTPWRGSAKAALAGDLKNPFPASASILATGKELYKSNCVQCHGEELKEDLAPALDNLKQGENEIFKLVYSGVPDKGMPEFGSTLGTEKVWKVVTYIKSKQKQ